MEVLKHDGFSCCDVKIIFRFPHNRVKFILLRNLGHGFMHHLYLVHTGIMFLPPGVGFWGYKVMSPAVPVQYANMSDSVQL